jgi:hypothetical protein
MTPAAATHTHQVSTPISSVGSGAPGVEDFSNKKKNNNNNNNNKQTNKIKNQNKWKRPLFRSYRRRGSRSATNDTSGKLRRTTGRIRTIKRNQFALCRR